MAPDDPKRPEAPDPEEATKVQLDDVDPVGETVVTPAAASDPAARPQGRPDASAPDPEQATVLESEEVEPEDRTIATPSSKSASDATAESEVDPQAPTILDTSDDPDADVPRAALIAPELEPGSTLFGEYVIEKRIGAGGMGEVYKAHHRRLNEARAVKVVRHALGGEDAASRLFDREARALLKISHPAVVRCHDLLSDDAGRVYLVMEFVEGVSLWDRIRARPLDHDELRALGDRLASGLASAHSEGVVHRDLSPDNVVLPDGLPERAKLIDFGIAKEIERSETTILEGFKGKLMYASPEQLGFYDGRVGPASDYYTLGLLLAAAAKGESLEMGGSLIQAVEARRSPPDLPSELPDDLRKLVRRLLAQDPAKRPASLDELRLRPALPEVGGGRPWRVPAGIAAVAVIAVGVWLGRDAAGPKASPPPALLEEPVPEPAQAEEPPAPEPAAAKPRAPSAKERAEALRTGLKVDGLLAGARTALEEGRLTEPAGDNAVEKYRAVLKLDSRNREARAGLEGVGARYIELADSALSKGNVEAASGFAAHAAKLAPQHPKLAATRAAVKSAGEAP